MRVDRRSPGSRSAPGRKRARSTPQGSAHAIGRRAGRARRGGEILGIAQHEIGACEREAGARTLPAVAARGEQKIAAPRRERERVPPRERREHAVIGHVVRIHQVGRERRELAREARERERIAHDAGKRQVRQRGGGEPGRRGLE
jgi:hypothetical protein